MLDGRKILAIIPARGGSKRLPKKNILPLAGKPLIAWTIDAAIKSQAFAEVMVNTDDNEIAEISCNYGATIPFIRPGYLGEDTSTSVDVIKHTLLWYKNNGVNFTEVVLLQPTSPLRNEKDITVAIELYKLKNAASVLSVTEVDHPTNWCNTLDSSLSMKGFIKTDNRGERSQDFDKEYRLNGAIYIWNVEKFLIEGKTIIEPSFASVMVRNRSVDIDEKIDFDLAEFLLSQVR
jgi:CMP-N-acetylneuraminic acid synthetase